ncbi:MAG: VCBS repeat-containing protein, partial [Bacteroidetes bacterium]|nr:VCBS repeat-containing protein [Bacteroidota bacterium]
MKNHYLILFIFILSISKTLSYAQPSISSFAPSSGPVGTVVTITGTNFNTTPTNNIVFFGATQATVNAGTTTSLDVTVTVGATYQPISVLDITTGLVAYSKQPFSVTFTCGGGITPNSFAEGIDSVAGLSPRTVCVGDLDGDGKGDLIIGNQGSAIISVFRNTSTIGLISFAPKVDFNPGGIDPFSIEIGDLDGDGRLDIVLVNYNSNAISIFRNTSTIGTISLATKIDFITTNYPMSVSIGDLDADGKPDLAVGCWYLNSVPILRNTSTIGTISFAPKIDVASGSLPLSVFIGELDGDNMPDLTVVNNSSNNVSVFRNTSINGSISFATRINYGMLDPRSVSVGDLDGDGKSEIAVTGRYNSISVLRNNSTIGSISFEAKIDFGTGANPYIASMADMDGDGKTDFVVGNVDDNTVSVLRNLSTIGNLSFAGKVDYATGGGPYSVSLGDIDGDGRLDITSANNFSNTVSVLKNQVFIEPTMTSLTTATICSGGILSIPLTSDIPATYEWLSNDNPNTSGESTASQTTNTLSDIITNNTTSAQTVTYTVTPTSSTGCGVGIPQTLVITVNPAPIMTNASIASVCSGGNLSIPLTCNIPATYTWLATDNINSIGESTTIQTTSTLTNTITNNTNTIQTVTYTVTPTALTSMCFGTPQTLVVTVNPTPISNAGNDLTICSGIAGGIGATAVAGNTYSWNPSSGLSDATVSNPANSTVNNGSTPIVTTYTISTTITATGCQSTDISVITINPQPILTITNAVPVCFPNTVDITASAVTIGSTGGGVLSYWTDAVATNSLSSPNAIVASGTNYIKVTAVGGCTDIKPVTATVNPLPISNAGNDLTICSGIEGSIGATAVAGNTYSWNPSLGLSDATVS